MMNDCQRSPRKLIKTPKKRLFAEELSITQIFLTTPPGHPAVGPSTTGVYGKTLNINGRKEYTFSWSSSAPNWGQDRTSSKLCVLFVSFFLYLKRWDESFRAFTEVQNRKQLSIRVACSLRPTRIGFSFLCVILDCLEYPQLTYYLMDISFYCIKFWLLSLSYFNPILNSKLSNCWNHLILVASFVAQ